jgi:hypothetical protein
MRALSIGLATLLLSSVAAAEPPTSESGNKLTGYGLTGTGVVVTGAGGYLFYRGLSHSDDLTSTKLGVAMLAGGLITTGVGVMVLLSPPEKKIEPPKPKAALVIGPASASFVRSF